MGKRKTTLEPATLSRQWLWILSALAACVAGWSAFLWWELVKARTSGADPFCAFGDAGACGALWDAPFAATIHRLTGVPVAGWGVVWGVAALAVPLVLLRQGSIGGKRRNRRLGAIRLLSLLGLVGVVILLGASAAAGVFCSSCAFVYVVAGLYGVLGLRRKGDGKASLGAGVPTTVGTLILGFLVVLIPGLQTPRGSADAERLALAAAVEGAVENQDESAELRRATEKGMPAWLTTGNGTGDPTRDRQLRQLIGSLAAPMRQGLADALWSYANAPALPAEEPRLVEGPATAPVRIVEFTDTLCSHCASLQETLEYLRTVVEADSFSVERRHYPLDGNCNAELPVRGPETVRCLAARVKICLEGRPGYEELTKVLYRDQLQLTPEKVLTFAEAHVPKAELEACVADPATEAKLAADVAYASRFDPRGTPLVVINGREGTSFAPFLYAIVLTGGAFSHPAFAALPAPRSVAAE